MQFCCRLYGDVGLNVMPCCSRMVFAAFEMYYLALSVVNSANGLPWVRHILPIVSIMRSRITLRLGRKYGKLYLLCVLMNDMTQAFPCRDVGVISPHI